MTSYMVHMWSRRAERGRALELLYCLNQNQERLLAC